MYVKSHMYLCTVEEIRNDDGHRSEDINLSSYPFKP